jgi:hypothetical protein
VWDGHKVVDLAVAAWLFTTWKRTATTLHCGESSGLVGELTFENDVRNGAAGSRQAVFVTKRKESFVFHLFSLPPYQSRRDRASWPKEQ